MTNSMRSLWHDEEGATMVEYSLAVALIALVCIAGFAAVGQSMPKMEEVPAAMAR